MYPFYMYVNNPADDWANYFAIDGPDDQQKWFQIGAGSGTSDFDRAWYTDRNEDGDKMYFQNGKSMRDILTLAAWGRVGFNIPTLLGTKTPPDGFSIFPQYFDYVARYDGNTYYDYTSRAYVSAGDPFVLLSSANDTLLVGKLYPRRSIYLSIATPAGTPGNLQVRYSKEWWLWWDAVWLWDTTNRLRQAGNISWNMDAFKSTWEKRTINGQSLYWMQISLSSLAGNVPTSHLVTNLWTNRFALYAGAGDISPMFAIDSSARLGILPPELTGKYEMGKLPGMTSSQVEIISNNPLKSDLVNYIANDSSAANSAIFLAKSKWTVDVKTAVSSSDILWGIYGYGYDGNTFRNAAGITISVDGNPAVLDMPGKISFLTTPDGESVALERMTIKNDGRIGIGTTWPTQTLTVSGNINVTAGHTIYDGNGNPYITSTSLNTYLTSEADPIYSVSAAAGISVWNISNWNTAYGRGNHRTMGYLTGWSLSVYATTSSLSSYVLQSQTGNRNTAYARGDHRTMWYITGYTETDPFWNVQKINYYTTGQVNTLIDNVRAGMVYQWLRDYSTGALPSNVHKWDMYEIGTWSTWHNWLDLYIRDIIIANKDKVGASVWSDWTVIIMDANPNIDPIFTASAAFNVTNLEINHWNAAYGRGNHASAWYLTGWSLSAYATTSLLSSYVLQSQTGNRNTAYGRGNHRIMWYLTGYTETDPLWTSVSGNYYTTLQIDTMMAWLAGWLVYVGSRDYSTGALPRDVHKWDMYIISSSPSNPALDFHIESPDEIIAKRNVVGPTTSWDWDVVEMDMVEQDPIYSVSAAAGISVWNISNWNTAYGRGNHASAWYLTGWSLSAYATTSSLSSYVLQSQTGNWNTAYGRGNHRTMGYLTGESDPLYAASAAHGITATDITHWDTVYSRGDRRTQWFMTSYTENDPVWNAAKGNYVLQSQTGNRNTAYGRGNHASAWYLTGWSLVGYLTGGSMLSYVLSSATGNWNTAYGRGNHASAWYLLSSQSGNWNTDYTWYSNNSWNALYFRNNSGSYYTKTQIDAKWYLTNATADIWYTLDVQATTSNPTVSQTIYLGQLPASPTTTAATRKVYIRKAGTITMANIYTNSSTAGTNEIWSWYIRLNNTTDYLIQTVSLAVSERIWSNSSLNIPVVAGDYIEIKMINPNWGTKPTNTIFGWYIYVSQ